jgi:hypothetical protein
VAARTALLLIVLVAVACVLFTPRAISPSRSGARAHPAVAATSADGPADHHTQQDVSDGAIDLYGNEVIDAIATYSLDPGGSLYEVHSPQTELPKLGSPKS